MEPSIGELRKIYKSGGLLSSQIGVRIMTLEQIFRWYTQLYNHLDSGGHVWNSSQLDNFTAARTNVEAAYQNVDQSEYVEAALRGAVDQLQAAVAPEHSRPRFPEHVTELYMCAESNRLSKYDVLIGHIELGLRPKYSGHPVAICVVHAPYGVWRGPAPDGGPLYSYLGRCFVYTRPEMERLRIMLVREGLLAVLLDAAFSMTWLHGIQWTSVEGPIAPWQVYSYNSVAHIDALRRVAVPNILAYLRRDDVPRTVVRRNRVRRARLARPLATSGGERS